MAATPMKNAKAPATAARTGTFRLAALVLLVSAICGAIGAVFVFYNIDEGEAAVKSEHGSAPRTASLESGVLSASEFASECKPQKCKIGGGEICGTDGKTYLNECYFKNAQCKNSSLQKVADWKGYNCPHTCTKQIWCKEIGKYLCASDGNVYFGYCKLYIAQCLDPKIEEVECDNAIFEGAFK